MIILPSKALEIVNSNFSGYLQKGQLYFLQPTPRSLYNERGTTLSITNDIVVPTVCIKNRILLPHDFSANGIQDYPSVRSKYVRRQNRLIHRLQAGDPITFVYAIEDATEWQSRQLSSAGVYLPTETYQKVRYRFEKLRKIYPQIGLKSLTQIQRKHGPIENGK